MVCGVISVADTSRFANVSLSNVPLNWCDKFTYLGIQFLFSINLILDVANRICEFRAALNAILRERVLDFEYVYVKLLLTKCMPILFYRLDLLTVSKNVMLTLTKAWNMAFVGSLVSENLILLVCC